MFNINLNVIFNENVIYVYSLILLFIKCIERIKFENIINIYMSIESYI